MESISEHKPKPPSHAKTAIEEIRKWDTNDLLGWIGRTEPKLLKGDVLEKFKEAYIDGRIFLKYAGKDEDFHQKYRLPLGISERLTDLAAELVGKDQDTSIAEHTTGSDTRKRKSLPPIDADAIPPTKRTRVGQSNLFVNNELKHFRSGSTKFSHLLQEDGQAYFDRTGYISKLHGLEKFILFCRPRRFGKSLTVSMLEHFHGLQYAAEHQTFYQHLAVQKDIEKRVLRPGQYFVLKFDFSSIPHRSDPTEANEFLVDTLNTQFRMFYRTYAQYSGRDFESLCKTIHPRNPNVSLAECVETIQDAIKQNKDLANIVGVYILVDEYDSFPNSHLKPSQGIEKHKRTNWEQTIVGATFLAFWTEMKRLAQEGRIRRIFITGISPLSLTLIGSGFNIARNLTFHKDVAQLCGLMKSELGEAIQQVTQDPTATENHLSRMTRCFNGYHFCKDERVETVYNTETCLSYLQSCIEKVRPETEDPQNSEVSSLFLDHLATSTSVIGDLEDALKRDDKGNFMPIKYGEFKMGIKLQDLYDDDCPSWRSLTVYYGGFTFDPEKPTTHLKIPNNVAASRIALAILNKYAIRDSLGVALQRLITDGELGGALGCYRRLMMERDVTSDGLAKKTETDHRDSFYSSLLKNHQLRPKAEFKVTKSNNTNGRVDIVVEVPGRLIVTEWKFYRMPYLEIKVGTKNITDPLEKAVVLRDYTLSQILQLRFVHFDKLHSGTVGSWVREKEVQQLKDYIRSNDIQQKVRDGRELQAHLVIIVGSRHILLWDMDPTGTLVDEPRLIKVPGSNGLNC